MNRAIFLDRDGVINRVILRGGKPFSPRTVEEFIFRDDIATFVSESRKAGFLNIVITNQPDVARGLVDVKTIQAMNDLILKNLAVDDVFFCSHDDGDNCQCRKPKSGMLIDAADKWDIDLTASFVIGDQWKDVQAGKKVCCGTILLDCPYNKNVECDYRAVDLQSALTFITRSRTGAVYG